jgi:hypothetical protein
VRCELLQRTNFTTQPKRFQRAIGNQNEAISIERLLNEVVCPALDGGDRRFNRAVARDHDHGQVGMLPLYNVKECKAVEPATLKPDIQQQEIRTARTDGGQRVLRVLRRANRIAFILQDAGHQIPNIGLVVHNQNIGGHSLTR